MVNHWAAVMLFSDLLHDSLYLMKFAFEKGRFAFQRYVAVVTVVMLINRRNVFFNFIFNCL